MGIGEIVFIVSLVVVVFGLRHIPKIVGYLGASARSFKKGLKGTEDERKIREINPKK